MELEIEFTLAELVQKYPSAASLFEKYDLDYCCYGHQNLQEACQGDLMKYKRVEHSLQGIAANAMIRSNVVQFENMDVRELIDHIITKHHDYLREAMPQIHAHLEKVYSKHGDRHPELKQIYDLFREFQDETNHHLEKEEMILFPLILELYEVFYTRNTRKVTGSYLLLRKLSLSEPIRVMETEHEKADSILHLIRELTNNYNPLAEACTMYRLAFNELKEFEQDLHQHVHLENNILFTEAVKLEDNLLVLLSN